MNNAKMTDDCSPYGLLACKIVERAVLDWRAAARSKSDSARFRMDEIRTFFCGKWCADLLCFSNMDGEYLLELLEREGGELKGRGWLKNAYMLTIDGRTATLKEWCRELGMQTNASTFYRMYREYGREYTEEQLAAKRRELGL